MERVRKAVISLQAAIAESGNQPLIPWEQAKAKLDLD
jgi:hypothetical protein